jgi:hypothetical protein
MIQRENMRQKKEQEQGKLMFCRDPNLKKAKLSDFEIINMIGRGSIANVFLVKKLDDD